MDAFVKASLAQGTTSYYRMSVSFCWVYPQQSYQLGGTLKPFSGRKWCKKLENESNEHLFILSVPLGRLLQNDYLTTKAVQDNSETGPPLFDCV